MRTCSSISRVGIWILGLTLGDPGEAYRDLTPLGC